MDTDLLWFYARMWNLRVTDLMQGPVYGLFTDENEDHEHLFPFFNYDEIFGTVLNRFVVQHGGVSVAEISDLMARLFETERTERAALLERARRVDPDAPSTSRSGRRLSRSRRVFLHQAEACFIEVPEKSLHQRCLAKLT